MDEIGHRSPLATDLLHRIGFIEKAGTGNRRIRDEALDPNCPKPQFNANRFAIATFHPTPKVRAETAHVTAEETFLQNRTDIIEQVTEQVPPETRPPLQVTSGEMTKTQIREVLDTKHREHFRSEYLVPALRDGLIEIWQTA